MPVSISGDGAITGLELEAFEDVDVGSGASDGDVLTYDASGDLWIPQGIVLPAGVGSNVVQTVTTSQFSTSSGTFVDVTGLTATITPSSATAKVLVVAQVNVGFSTAQNGSYFRINGGNASTYIGDADGSRSRVVAGFFNAQTLSAVTTFLMLPFTVVFLDSPATASPVTYALQARTNGSSTTLVNRTGSHNNNADSPVGASSITAIEVAA